MQFKHVVPRVTRGDAHAERETHTEKDTHRKRHAQRERHREREALMTVTTDSLA